MATWNWNEYIDPTKQGQLALAKQYADAGMFARAKAAFEAAGGTWTNEVHRQLKTEAAATTRYGGDIEFKWADYGVKTQEQLNKIIDWAKAGNFGRIKQMIDNLGGAKNWDSDGNRLHKKLGAEYLGFQPVGTDPATPSTEFKRVEPTVAPVFKPAPYTNPDTGLQVDPSTIAGEKTPWRAQFISPITKQQEGSWETGQARNDAQKWRNAHMNAEMNKYGLSRDATSGEIKRGSNAAGITDTQWNDFIKKRNEIATRFERMITPSGS